MHLYRNECIMEEKSFYNGNVIICSKNSENIPNLWQKLFKKTNYNNNRNIINIKQKTKIIQPEFNLLGLDYLSDFEKRRERIRANVPKLIKLEGWNWNSTYQTIFGQSILNKPIKNITTCDTNLPLIDMCMDEQVFNSSVAPSLMSNLDNEWKYFKRYPFQNLVMSGGGCKGYAFLGALKALEACNILKNINHIAGSSAGAICAGLLSVGCTPQDIANVFKFNIKWLFQDEACAMLCCLPNMCKKFGIFSAKKFFHIYGQHIAKKTGNKDITFKEVSEKFGCELTIVVTNLSRMCSEYCNSKTCPDLPIRKAVRMSMAFPVVFRAIRENIFGTECVYTDGGMLDHYPIHCFDENDAAKMNTEKFPGITDDCNMRTIGLYVFSERPIDYKIWKKLFGIEIPYKPTYLPNTKLARARLKLEMQQRARNIKDFKKKEYMDELRASVGDKAVKIWDHYEIHNKSNIDINNFGDYFVMTIESLLITQLKMHVKPNDIQRTVAINCGYIMTNDYIIEAGDREFMIIQGYVCTLKYLNCLIKKLGYKTTPLTSNVLTNIKSISLNPNDEATDQQYCGASNLASNNVAENNKIDGEVLNNSTGCQNVLTNTFSYKSSKICPLAK